MEVEPKWIYLVISTKDSIDCSWVDALLTNISTLPNSCMVLSTHSLHKGNLSVFISDSINMFPKSQPWRPMIYTGYEEVDVSLDGICTMNYNFILWKWMPWSRFQYLLETAMGISLSDFFLGQISRQKYVLDSSFFYPARSLLGIIMFFPSSPKTIEGIHSRSRWLKNLDKFCHCKTTDVLLLFLSWIQGTGVRRLGSQKSIDMGQNSVCQTHKERWSHKLFKTKILDRGFLSIRLSLKRP